LRVLPRTCTLEQRENQTKLQEHNFPFDFSCYRD
jgi:hypothetical protein